MPSLPVNERASTEAPRALLHEGQRGGPGVGLPPPTMEVAVVFALVFAATALLGLGRAWPAVRDLVHLGIAFVFLFVPLRLARREPEGAARFGIDLGGLLEPTDERDDRPAGPLGLYDLGRAVRAALPSGMRELAFTLALCAVVFPPFVVGFWAWHQPARAFSLAWPSDLGSFALTQVVLVGLPEEAFFRGYVQTRLADAWPAPRRWLGAPVRPVVLVLQALLFAAVHLATEPHVQKLAVFFPGLLFGWLRARRGGIGASILFHAASNVVAEVLVRSWL